MTTPSELLAAARRLLDQPADATAGLWPRAAALLARQALEGQLAHLLDAEAPGASAAPFTTQLLVLRSIHPNPDLAARVAYAWNALSRATHHHGYELPPTAVALRSWISTIEDLEETA